MYTSGIAAIGSRMIGSFGWGFTIRWDNSLIMGRFFEGSPEALVMGLAESEDEEPEVLEQLQDELRKQREKRDD